MMKRMVIALLWVARKAGHRQGNHGRMKRMVIALHFAVAPLVVAAAALVVVVAVGLALPAPCATPTLHPILAGTGDYDVDKDGLIEVSNLAQLAAIRADLNGDGVSPAPAHAAAFPNAIPGMGCPDGGCTGYELIADLDFDTNGNCKADAGDAYWNDGKGWIPIGDYGHKFITTFEGNVHTIANLYIEDRHTRYVGLFGYVTANSSINRVGLVSVDISGFNRCSGCGQGGLVGFNDGSIADSYVTGNVSGSGSVGGLAGLNTGAISRSHTTTDVSGYWEVGGLVGYNSGTIVASYATGSVAGNGDYVSGLVGSGGGSISSSYAVGSVSGVDYVGGLVGSVEHSSGSSISSSYAMGSVSGVDYVGGLAGRISSGSNIIASYATGSVFSDDDIGGLVGRNEGGSITDSYAVGRVSTESDAFYIGGLIGYDEGSDIAASASYWDTETTGLAGSYGGMGKTTSELQSPTDATGIYAGWDPDWWDFGTARQYPVLKYGGLDVAAQR